MVIVSRYWVGFILLVVGSAALPVLAEEDHADAQNRMTGERYEVEDIVTPVQHSQYFEDWEKDEVKDRGDLEDELLELIRPLVLVREQEEAEDLVSIEDGELVVFADAVGQQEVAHALEEIRKTHRIRFSFDSVLLVVPGDVDRAVGLDVSPDSPFLGEDQGEKLIEAVRASRDGKVVISPLLTVRGGQRGVAMVMEEVVREKQPGDDQDGNEDQVTEVELEIKRPGFVLEAKGIPSNDPWQVNFSVQARYLELPDQAGGEGEEEALMRAVEFEKITVSLSKDLELLYMVLMPKESEIEGADENELDRQVLVLLRVRSWVQEEDE